MSGEGNSGEIHALAGPVRDWFEGAFPGGPTEAQRLAWPLIASGEHLLLISPTGTGKTLAAFLAIIDEMHREHAAGTLTPGLRCVYVSPLRSLGYDIERNLAEPLEAIRRASGWDTSPVTVGVRTGDTTAAARRKLRDQPPHLLITTPESLSLMLSQSAWHEHWRGVRQLIVDEVHALMPTKRGADLAVSLERLSARADRDPSRVGLSATCRPPEPVARFLVGPGRACRVVEAAPPAGSPPTVVEVESLLKPDEATHRGLSYRRLLRRLGRELRRNRTTVVFANTRAFAEQITHDLRRSHAESPDAIAAHHSALDAGRRRAVEEALRGGELKAVVTSTSLELGVDIGSADLSVQVGLPGSVSRCIQRVGRSGHRWGVASRGLLLASSAAELAGAVVTAGATRQGRVEPLRSIRAPLDVLCQQLIGMACGGRVGCRRRLRPDPTRRPDGRPDPRRLRRLPRLPGRRPRRARRGVRARARRRAARELAADLASAGPVRGPQSPRDALVLGQRRDDHLRGVGPRRGRREARSARSRGPTPSGCRPATASCSTAVPWSSAAWRAWSCRRGRPAASRTCPAGRATARACRASWRSTSPGSARTRRSPWPTAPRPSVPGSSRPTTSTPESAAVLEALFEAQEQFSEVPAPGTLARRGIARRGRRLDLHLPRPPEPGGLRGPGPRDRRTARPPVRPRPGADRRRPRLVDPTPRGGPPAGRTRSSRSSRPRGSPTTCSKGSTAATCWRGGSATSPARR